MVTGGGTSSWTDLPLPSGMMRKGHTLLFFCGRILLLLGGTLQYYIRKEQKPVPLFLGYSLLLVSVVGYILLPLSSFWLLIPQALIMIGVLRWGVKAISPRGRVLRAISFWHAEWN